MLLALDTATRALSLALHSGEMLLAEHSWQSHNYHTIELAPQVAHMLQQAAVSPAQLSGIAVALGPGSYTGLRIGLGFAKGLALAQNVPLIGVSTFESLIRAQAPCPELTLAIVQAGRGRVSVAAYRWQADEWQLVTPARVLTWAALAAEISTPTYACGEIDAAGRELLMAKSVRLAPPAQALRRAGYLAEIGWERLRRQQTDDPARLAPAYGNTLDGSGA